jgi:hypothetical protein
MIVDCFTFFEEFDVLELRLRTLENIVDRFVICEAPFTFRGNAKPLHLAAALGRFERWRERITLLTYPGPPSTDPWDNERGQRDYLAAGLAGCAPDDLVLIGDCDEIPDPRFATQRPSIQPILAHRMVLADGYVNRLAMDGASCRHGTRALAVSDLSRYSGLADVRERPLTELEFVDSGWHFTSLGGAAVMERKLAAYSHAEYDVAYCRDHRRLAVTYESAAMTRWPIDERFPPPLRDDPERWDRFIWKEQTAIGAAHAASLGHAHGCFAYVPDGVPAVAVLAPEPTAWLEAGRERFAGAFAGAFADLPSLLRATGRRSWVVIDGLERHPRHALAALQAAGMSVVAYGVNARSFDIFQRVLGPEPARFPTGRALGRAEYLAEIAAADFDVQAVDRIATAELYIFPPKAERSEQVAVGPFAFPVISNDALLDFLSSAFVFALAPLRHPEHLEGPLLSD